MNRLDRYLARRWLLSFFPSLVALVAVYLGGDTVFTMWDLIKRDIPPYITALHFALKTPTMFYQMTPVAALVATLLTLTGMKRSGEITAAFVSGTGIIRLSMPFLLIALAVSTLSYYMNETVAPSANRISRDLVRTRSGSGSSVVGTERIWLLEENRIVYIMSVQRNGTELLEPTILQFRGTGLKSLELRVDAKRAYWKDGSWFADETYNRRFEDGLLTQTRKLENILLPISIQPGEFHRIRRKPEEMSRAELVRYVEDLKMAGLPFDWHNVRIYRKASAASLSLVFTVIALPVGFLVPIRGGVPLGIGLSIFLAILFWSAFSFCLSLGYSGLIPAPAAAWVSQIVFLTLGLVALVSVRRPRLT
jgi:lipopolysaccharide export system permease protein